MLTFDQVCGEIAGKPTSLLLGNGFSVAYNPIFKYNNLKDEVFKKAFADMGVEEIMLRVSSQPNYLVDCLKKGFISAISAVHPEWATEEKIRTCATFLKHFDKVYTLNYDLLLYWVINSTQELLDKFKDGFGIERVKRYPNWPNAGTTSTFYLHGSLLLLCSKPTGDQPICPRRPVECCIAKYIRPRSSASLKGITSLIDILKKLSESGQYPHFVSEGHPKQKYSRIQKCTYLKGCYDALKNESGNLVTFGTSFENDQHILGAIKTSNVKCCYVGIYGYGKNPDADRKLLHKAKSLRTDSRTVKVYETETAKVWQQQ